MSNFALIVGGVAVNMSANPAAEFHADIAAQFVPVPDDVRRGWVETAGVWSAPPAPPAPALVFPPLSLLAFYLSFTPAERIAIRASTDPLVREFWSTYLFAATQPGALVDPTLTSIIEGLAWLATPTTATPPGPGILATPARIAQIQAGVPQ